MERIEALLTQTDGMLESCGVERVDLERKEDSAERRRRVAEVQACAIQMRPFPKNEDVALHDALLWEAVEKQPMLADSILTQDRTLQLIEVDGRKPAMMLDAVVAFALLGGANEEDLTALFSHALSRDLHPDTAFLSLPDLQTIANMESRLLAGPARALRRAAGKLATMRANRLRSGSPLSRDEVEGSS